MADRINVDEGTPFPHKWFTQVVASDGTVLGGYGQTAEEAEAQAAAKLARYEALIAAMTPETKLAELGKIKGELSAEEMSEAIKALTQIALTRQIR